MADLLSALPPSLPPSLPTLDLLECSQISFVHLVRQRLEQEQEAAVLPLAKGTLGGLVLGGGKGGREGGLGGSRVEAAVLPFAKGTLGGLVLGGGGGGREGGKVYM
jgi:hypothetical protein